MNKMTIDPIVMARENALVDAQILLQRAMNEMFGNPRDFEEENPDKTAELFKKQRRDLAKRLGRSKRWVNRLFADDAKLKIKDLAEALNALDYDLKIIIDSLK